MKIFIFLGLILSSMSSFASDSNLNRIVCSGMLEGRGILEIKLEREADGNWKLFKWNAGKNISNNKNIILLDTYGSFLKKNGVYARFDIQANTIEFKYKYDSGLFNGGVLKESGTFTDCVTE
jgi:hypothetical protein